MADLLRPPWPAGWVIVWLICRREAGDLFGTRAVARGGSPAGRTVAPRSVNTLGLGRLQVGVSTGFRRTSGIKFAASVVTTRVRRGAKREDCRREQTAGSAATSRRRQPQRTAVGHRVAERGRRSGSWCAARAVRAPCPI